MEAPKNVEKRCFGIDAMKIMAAFMITFYHFKRIDYGFSVGEYYIPNLNRLLMNVCVISVPLFFMCNGAILLNKDYSLKKIWGKALKIIFLMVIWSWTDFPSWFFRTLCILYLFFPVLKHAVEKKRWMLYVICLCLLVVPFLLNLITTLLKILPKKIVVAGVNLTDMGNTGLFTMYSILYFLLGGILMRHRLPAWVSALLIVFGFALNTVEGIIYTNYYGTVYDGVNSSFPTMGALAMSVGMFDLFMRWEPPKGSQRLLRIVTFTSRNILGVYLFHMTIILRLKVFMTEAVYPAWLVFSVCPLIDAVCILICELLRKIPYVRKLVVI